MSANAISHHSALWDVGMGNLEQRIFQFNRNMECYFVSDMIFIWYQLCTCGWQRLRWQRCRWCIAPNEVTLMVWIWCWSQSWWQWCWCWHWCCCNAPVNSSRRQWESPTPLTLLPHCGIEGPAPWEDIAGISQNTKYPNKIRQIRADPPAHLSNTPA